MKFEPFRKKFTIQLAWARVKIGKGATAIDIENESGQSRSMVQQYTADMKCLSDQVEYVPNGTGRPSPKRERIHVPGDICNHCPFIASCIIRSLSKGEVAISDLPGDLAIRTYYLY